MRPAISRPDHPAFGIRSLPAALVTLVLALQGTLAAPPAGASDEEAKPTPLTTVEGITEYRLDNGLKVLLFPDPSVPTVTVNVTYLVGSRHEGRGEAGMAHLLEHMVFKGTPTFQNIWGALQDHGARFNGTTWVDRTNYFETLEATQENLDFALAMEADRMVNSLISAEELAKEMTVVRNEFEMGENDPLGVLQERMLSAAFLWHNYGKSTIGNKSDIERVPAESLRAFYEKYYQPDNAILVVAGNLDVDWTLERVLEHFGAIPRPERELTETYTVEPTQDGPREVILERVGSLASAGVLYHTPAGSHPDSVALDILGEVMTERPSGRLYRALVEGDLATRVSHANYSWHDPAVIVFQSSVRLDQQVDDSLQTMIEVVEGVAGTISEEEVERARAKLLRQINLGLTDSRRIGILLSEWEAMGDWRLMFLHRDRVKQATVEDVNRVADHYLVASNRTSGLFRPTSEPERAEIPPAPELEELLDDYRGDVEMDSGAAFEATAANIESSTWRGEVGPLEVALLSKETRGNVVQAELVFPYGTEASLSPHVTPLELMPALMMRGTERLSHQEIRDEINRIESEIQVYGGPGSVRASIKTTRSNLPAALELLAEILRRPTFPADELEIVRQERLSRLERMLTDPQGLVFNALSRALSPFPPDSLFYVPTFEEEIERLKGVQRQEIVDLHRRFLSAEHARASFVGDFDRGELQPRLEEIFGEWRSSEPYERPQRPFESIAGSDVTIDTPDKKMAMVVRGAPLPLRDDDPAYATLRFANYIFGLSPKSRLLTALRHEGGLSYGANSIIHADDEDRAGEIIAYAICAPENVAEAQQVMQQEFRRWVEEPIGAEEIREFLQGYEREFKTSLGNDGYIARQLLSDLRTDRPFTFHEELVSKAATLTPEEIHRTLQATVGEASFADIKGGDASKFGGSQ